MLRCGFCKDSYLSKNLDSSCEGGRLAGRPTGIYMSVRALHGQRRSCDLLFIVWCCSEDSQLVSHLFPLLSTWTLESAVLVSLFLRSVALWQTLHRVLIYKCLWLLRSFSLAIIPSSFKKYITWSFNADYAYICLSLLYFKTGESVFKKKRGESIYWTFTWHCLYSLRISALSMLSFTWSWKFDEIPVSWCLATRFCFHDLLNRTDSLDCKK